MHVGKAKGTIVPESAVEIIQSGREEILNLGDLPRGRCIGGHGRHLLRASKVKAAVALRLAVVGRSKISRLAGEIETFVMTPVHIIDSRAEDRRVVVRDAAEELGAVRHIGRVLDGGEIQRR